MFSEKQSVLYKNRYCTQEHFDVVYSGIVYDLNSYDDKNKIIKLKSPSFLGVEKYVYSKKYSDAMSTVAVGSFVCTISSCIITEENFILGDQYFGKQWKNNICMIDERKSYNVCSFLKQVFMVGGTDTNNCVKYDLNTEEWTILPSTQKRRYLAACTVFEGRIIVTGGIYGRRLKSVETYDHYENKWISLPEMIYARYDHDVVSMGNKMFVVGDKTQCEVFDSFSRKFTLIKKIPCDSYILYNSRIVASIGHKFTVYSTCVGESVIYSYDIVNRKWHKGYKKLETVKYVSKCIKVPST